MARVGYYDSFLDFIIVRLCLDCQAAVKTDRKRSMLPEINNKVRHFYLPASWLVFLDEVTVFSSGAAVQIITSHQMFLLVQIFRIV